jgi:hypothetical protein
MSDNSQIFIAKLSQRVSEKDLSSKFSKYGDIKNIQLRKGFAFIVIFNLTIRITEMPNLLRKPSTG